MKKALLLLGTMIVIVLSCSKDKNPIPDGLHINYLYTTGGPNVKVSDPSTLISITFDFSDSSQNIGNNPNETDSTIFLKDSRDTSGADYTYSFPMPFIPQERRKKDGIQGSVTLNLNNGFFSPKDSLHLALKKDTMVWSIFIRDNNGDQSNTIQTDTLYLQY